MKPSIVALSLALAAAASSGCAPQEMSVFVEGASFLDESCAATGDVQLIRGTLDLGPHIALNTRPRYIGHFGLRSDMQPIETQAGDDILAGSSRNAFVASSVILDYSVGGTSIASATDPIYFVIDPGSRDGFIQFNMLSAAVASSLTVGAGTESELLISFQFQGNLRSSTNALVPMRTPEVIFPIRLRNTPTTVPTCGAGQVPMIDGPCGNSQENYVVACST